MNKQFLNWIADRIVHVYGESPHVDFVSKLRYIANEPVADSKAITALTGMVKAFGSGVLATDTVQAAALAKAYACIEGDLMGKAEQSHGTKAAVEPVPAKKAGRDRMPREKEPLMQDMQPVEADRSVGDVMHDWPGGDVQLVDYVERNKGCRVRISFMSFMGNGVSDRVGVIDRIGAVMYFWVMDDQSAHGGRFSVAFCDVHTITHIPTRANPTRDVPTEWPTFPGPAIEEFLADKLGKAVNITTKDGRDVAGTLDPGGTVTYFWIKTRGTLLNVYFSDVACVQVLANPGKEFSATLAPYLTEEPVVLPDSWEKDDAARAAVEEIEKCARANIGVRVAVKFSDEKAGGVIGTIRTVTHRGYVCVEEDGANGTFMLNEIVSIEPLAITDSWPGGGVSLNSYLNDRAGALVTVNYGAGSDVTGEIFRNPLRPGQYRLLLRTGSAELFMSDVVSVSCDK